MPEDLVAEMGAETMRRLHGRLLAKIRELRADQGGRVLVELEVDPDERVARGVRSVHVGTRERL